MNTTVKVIREPGGKEEIYLFKSWELIKHNYPDAVVIEVITKQESPTHNVSGCGPCGY